MALDGGGSRFDNRGSAKQSYVPKANKPASVNVTAPNIPISFPSPQITSRPYQPPYQPPAQQWAPSPPQTPSFGIGAPSGGGIGGAPAPAPRPKPVFSEKDWLSGDSTYQNQLKEYGTSLNDFISRLATQKSDFMADYDTSKEGFGRNRDAGMLSVGEDFTNRGMANSGLFAKAQDDTTLNYKKQGDALDKGKSRALSDFSNQEKDKRASNKQATNNAKSASLGRAADKQMF